MKFFKIIIKTGRYIQGVYYTEFQNETDAVNYANSLCQKAKFRYIGGTAYFILTECDISEYCFNKLT